LPVLAQETPSRSRRWTRRCRASPTTLRAADGSGGPSPSAGCWSWAAGSCGRCWPSTSTSTTSIARTAPWGRQRRSGLANQLSPCRLGGVARRDRLGGLIHEYAQVACREPNNWHPHPVSRHSVVGLLRVVGLVVDGGVKIRAIQRADTLAAEARRAGGQAIRVPLAITGRDPSPLLALRPPRTRRTCGPTRSRATWSSPRRPQTLRGRRQHGSHGVLRADRSRHPDSSGQAAVTLVRGVSEATR
jgi:hypothetical protein